MNNRLSQELVRVITKLVANKIKQKKITPEMASIVLSSAQIYFDENADLKRTLNNLETFINKYPSFKNDLFKIRLQDFTS